MTTTVEQKEKRKSIVTYLSLRWKILIGFTLLFSVVFAVAFYWFYSFATQLALYRIQEDLVSTLKGAASGVNVDELLSLAKDGKPNAQGFSDDPRYTDQLNWLDTVHHIEPRAWPYIYVPGTKQNEIFYVVDLFARYDPTRSTNFMEEKISKGFSLEGFKGLTLRTVDGKFAPYTDQWGSWVSAYMPITDSQGQTVAAMGVDFEASYVDQVRQSILNSVFLAFVLTYGILFLLVYIVSRALTSPIQKVTLAAEKIGESQYEEGLEGLEVRGRFRDEISKLSEVFADMTRKVYEREQFLRKQVENLQIVIDQGKRQKQVSEITESDFFQDLRSKARDMRKRTKSDDSSKK